MKLFDENGKYILNEKYTEILKLDNMLTEAQIPHTLKRFCNGWQIIYPNEEKRVADVVQHFGSYGNEKNLLEIMGLIKPEETCDSVLGWLTAEDVFRRFSEHYKGEKK